MLNVSKHGSDWLVNDDIVEIGQVWRLPNGHFAVKVHGLYFRPDGSPTTHGGSTATSCKTMSEALVNAGYLYARHKGQISGN